MRFLKENTRFSFESKQANAAKEPFEEMTFELCRLLENLKELSFEQLLSDEVHLTDPFDQFERYRGFSR